MTREDRAARDLAAIMDTLAERLSEKVLERVLGMLADLARHPRGKNRRNGKAEAEEVTPAAAEPEEAEGEAEGEAEEEESPRHRGGFVPPKRPEAAEADESAEAAEAEPRRLPAGATRHQDPNGLVTWRCPKCPKLFVTAASLNRHYGHAHKEV